MVWLIVTVNFELFQHISHHNFQIIADMLMKRHMMVEVHQPN